MIISPEIRAMLLRAVQYLTEREAIETEVDGEDYAARTAYGDDSREDWLRLRGELVASMAGAFEPVRYTLVAHRESSECWHGGSCYGGTPVSSLRYGGCTPVELVSALADITQMDQTRIAAPKTTRRTCSWTDGLTVIRVSTSPRFWWS